MKKFIAIFLTLFVTIFAGRVLAQDDLSRGMSLLDKKDCAGALPYLQRAVKEDSRSAKANTYLGKAYLCLGKLDSATIFLKKAIDLNDEFSPAYSSLGEIYMQQKNYAEAINNFRDAVKNDSKNSSYVISLGYAYLAADSLDGAMKAFYKARDMNDKDPRAIEGIGDVYRKQGILDPAIGNYKEALQLDSLNVPLRLKLANTYMKNNDGADAYEQFVKVSSLEPNNPDGQYQAGELLFLNKRYREAFPFLEKYHQLVPSDDETLLQLAESALNAQLYPDAVKYYQEYLAKNPNSLVAKKSLAAAYYFGKKPLDSYNTYKAIPIDSLNVRELVRYGLAANAVHDTSAAIDAWSRAVKLDTTQSEIEYLLANALFSAKRYNEAITYFQKRLALEPNDVAAELNMGLCYFIIQNYGNAVAALRRVTVLKPDNYQGNLWLARALVFDDSLESAADVYGTFIKIAQADTTGNHSSDLNEAYRQIALSYVVQGSKFQKDNPDEAKKYYLQAMDDINLALKYDSKDIRTHVLLAQTLALLGKIDDACKECKLILKADPSNKEILKLSKSLGCE